MGTKTSNRIMPLIIFEVRRETTTLLDIAKTKPILDKTYQVREQSINYASRHVALQVFDAPAETRRWPPDALLSANFVENGVCLVDSSAVKLDEDVKGSSQVLTILNC